MQEFHTNHSSSFMSRHRTLVVSLAIVLVGGAGFAAAGGTEAVKQLFVTLQIIGPDGETQVVDAILQPTDDGGGTATMSLDVGDGKEATILLEKLPGEDAESETTAITVQLDGAAQADGGELGVTASFGQETNAVILQKMQTAMAGQRNRSAHGATVQFGRAVHPIVKDTIGDAVFSDNYEDKNGLWQEMSVVPEVNGDIRSFSVYTTFTNDADQTRYRRIGSMVGADPDRTNVTGIEWDEAGLATIQFVTEDGSEISLKVDPYDRADGTATMTFVKKDGSVGVVDLKSAPGARGAAKTIQIRRDSNNDR